METAVVGVLGALVGILLSNVLVIVVEHRRRRERIFDVQTSLRAEIRSHWRRLGPLDLRSRADLMVAKIETAAASGSVFTPFIPREDTNIVFDTIAAELQILPNQVIDPIVLYYSQLNAITKLWTTCEAKRSRG